MFEVEPDRVRDATPRFGDAAQTLQQALTAIEGTLNGLGDFWGGDSQGAQFASFHQPNRQRVLAALAKVQAGLDSIPPALRAQADGYERVDMHVADHLATFKPSPP